MSNLKSLATKLITSPVSLNFSNTCRYDSKRGNCPNFGCSVEENGPPPLKRFPNCHNLFKLEDQIG